MPPDPLPSPCTRRSGRRAPPRAGGATGRLEHGDFAERPLAATAEWRRKKRERARWQIRIEAFFLQSCLRPYPLEMKRTCETIPPSPQCAPGSACGLVSPMNDLPRTHCIARLEIGRASWREDVGHLAPDASLTHQREIGRATCR